MSYRKNGYRLGVKSARAMRSGFKSGYRASMNGVKSARTRKRHEFALHMNDVRRRSYLKARRNSIAVAFRMNPAHVSLASAWARVKSFPGRGLAM